jgi:predicted nucleotidyltransferase component of viral defense system
MPRYNKLLLAQKAKELHVVRDTFEKVCRLQEILRFFSSSELLSSSLALKGGTAINLLFFNMPRLSVDIDLDYCVNLSRDEMLVQRNKIGEQISKYMTSQEYSINPNSKTPHSLDSFVYDYINSAGIKDNIKIEINYSLRAHVLPIRQMTFAADSFAADFQATTLSPMEIYATKTVALLTRAAARDLYDMNYMIRYGLFDESETEWYRKCVVFYPPAELSLNALDTITPYKIRTDLYPVIRDKDSFNLESAKKTVTEYLTDTVKFSEKERQFLKKFEAGFYHPELLFDDDDIINKLKKHPMALWKTAKARRAQEI